ncbi:MAG: HAD-IB family hydrolase [Chloroflexia bacterium]|nr:HAD-IB family hydrolase [Chloroflexia bacterium]
MDGPPENLSPSSTAFFDIDRTLVVGTSLESCFLRQAMRRGLLGRLALWRNVGAGLGALGLLPKDKRALSIPAGLPLLTRLRYAFLSGNKAYLRGLSLQAGQALAQEMFEEEVLPRLSQRGQDLVRQHRAAGRPVVLLTGTLDFLGRPLQGYLQAEALLAARPQVREGRLTGRLQGAHPYGPVKRDLLREYAQGHAVDLATSYAYADHHSDVPFLQAVGRPTAVNPDPKLARIAQERGWPVERF